jgi:NHLM bacteriocin system ABC transporter peptidase/ATP-binding protein
MFAVRTPTVLQFEAVECGAACLGMILGYYGRHVPLPELRQACGVSRDGSRAAQIVRAARNYGLEAKGLACDFQTLRTVKAPYIVFWEFRHFVVVEALGLTGVRINDPASGHRHVSWQEFGECFTGVVLAMKPGPDFQRGGRPPRLYDAIRARLTSRWFAPLLFCLIAGLLLVLPALFLATASRVIIDAVLIQHRDDWLRPLAWIMLSAVVVQTALALVRVTGLRRLQIALSARLSSQFLWHLLRLPVVFHAQRFAGELAHRTRLNERAATTLSLELVGTMVALATMVVYGIVLALLSPMLMAVASGFVILNILALRAVYRARNEASQRLAQSEGRLMAASLAGVRAIETIKAGGMEDGYFAKWAGFQSETAVSRQQLERSMIWLNALTSLTEGLGLAGVLVLGGWQVIEGQITLGTLVAFQMLLAQFQSPVEDLVRLGGSLQEVHADLLRLDDVLLATPEVDPVAQAGKVPSPGDSPASGALELRGISFGYSPVDPALIEDLSLSIPPGGWVALVGRSGSGKSTIAKLAAGLYEPWSGEILLDGVSLAERPRVDRAERLGWVDQSITLFEGTIRENLTLWSDHVTDDAVLRALHTAAALPIVERLPGGLGGSLEEGGRNLSGGELQRLEIARAITTSPGVLVLDEASSALDAETEDDVFRRLRASGVSCLVVAHRLSTIRDCDEIIVIDAGKAVERGTHDELLRAGGIYAELVAEQPTS